MPLILNLNSCVAIRWLTIRVINVGIDVELKRKEKKTKENKRKEKKRKEKKTEINFTLNSKVVSYQMFTE